MYKFICRPNIWKKMAAPQTEAFESGTNFQFTRPREPFVSERGVDDLYPMTGFTVTQVRGKQIVSIVVYKYMYMYQI